AAVDSSPRPTGTWYRDVTATQWKAFLGAYMAWVLDGFDFTIITFLLVDIRRSFTVSAALAGALGTITLIFRVAGGIGAGTAADRWGRKGPLMFSILWYSMFAFFSGFSTSFRMLFALRALFGIGMGGVWAAGMPLTLEHWPAHLRGTASGMMQSGYSLGFLLSSLVFQLAYPLVKSIERGVARHVLDRRAAGLPRAVHHKRGVGESRVARTPAPSPEPPAARSPVAHRPVRARRREDDDSHVDPDG